MALAKKCSRLARCLTSVLICCSILLVSAVTRLSHDRSGRSFVESQQEIMARQSRLRRDRDIQSTTIEGYLYEDVKRGADGSLIMAFYFPQYHFAPENAMQMRTYATKTTSGNDLYTFVKPRLRVERARVHDLRPRPNGVRVGIYWSLSDLAPARRRVEVMKRAPFVLEDALARPEFIQKPQRPRRVSHQPRHQ